MKKSFKKAGAAVLSMSMLLSMGAISMPVYADNPTNWPGQVSVTIDGNSAWANDSVQGRTFNYLSDVTSAVVNLYKVAELGSEGWKWETGLANELAAYYTPDGATTQLNDFRKLLDTTTDSNGVEHFTATSEELLQVASALERAVRDSNNSVSPIATGNLVMNNGSGSVLLPGDTALAATENVIGYYLITTTTSEAGVVLQPVLITLKNSDNHDNPVTVALKGYKIDVEKTIATVADKDKNVALGGTVISSSHDTAVVAKDDVITYQIETEIPKYDVNLAVTNMLPFTITDTPDAGIVVTEASGSLGSQDWSPKRLVVKADNGTPETGDDVTLDLDSDYTVSADANGFTISIPASKYHTNSNKTGHKLEGQKIIATFEATIDDATFSTVNNATADYSDLKAAQVNAQSATAINASKTTYDAAITATDATAQTAFMAAAGRTATTDITEEDRVAAYLAVQEDSANRAYGNITADQINEKREQAKAILADVATRTAALAMASEDEAAVVDTLNNATNPAGTETSLTDDQKIQAYLALKALQATPAGNKNKGSITYGNQYATGQGDGKDEDDTTVYSVDLDLTKVSENLKLDRTTNWNTNPDHDTWYDKDIEEEYVSGAVFELIKEDDAHDDAAAKTPKSLGLAVSDANGKLWLLTKGAAQAEKPTIATTIATGAIAYFTTETNNGTTTYTPYTVAAMEDGNGDTVVTNQAWRKLTRGTYTLKELYAPAGYKVIPDLTINVEAARDANDEFNGIYSATTSDGAGDIVKSDNATAGALNYDGTAGALEARIVDPKADELPATGGIGTVLFTAGGISIVLIAGALFVMYMKKRNGEEEE